MNRRDALKSVGFIVGTSIIGAEAFLTGCVNKNKTFELNEDELAFLNGFGEAILPKSKTPGALEANVAPFMNTIVKDFYNVEEQKIFKDGIQYVNDISGKQFDKDFIDLTNENKDTLLMALEKEAQAHYFAENPSEHFYIMLKQLTIWGYLSSEIVAKNAFIHSPLVEKYIGSTDYKAGDKILYNDYGHQGSAYRAAINHIKKAHSNEI